MKTMHSADFYRTHADMFEGQHGVIQPERDLETFYLAGLRKNLPEELIEKVTPAYAKMVADELAKFLLEEKETYLKVMNNPNCLGYTTVIQSYNAAREITYRWEYNCFKLAEFKRKYNI